jgi:predicted transcriptional regulator
MVRVTPELKSAIDKCANRLKLRSADIVRYFLANAIEEFEAKAEIATSTKDEIGMEEYHEPI